MAFSGRCGPPQPIKLLSTKGFRYSSRKPLFLGWYDCSGNCSDLNARNGATWKSPQRFAVGWRGTAGRFAKPRALPPYR